MKDFKVTMDLTAIKQKPITKAEISKISKNVKNQVSLSLIQFKTFTEPPYSYTWAPGIFDGRRKSENWKEQQVFALDFDTGITPEQIKTTFQVFGITPNLFYKSFSDSPNLRKFRICLVLDRIVDDSNLAKSINRGLMKLFPEADPATKDLARMFFGGKSSEIWNEVPISTDQLIEIINIKNIELDGGRTRKVINFTKKQVADKKSNNKNIRINDPFNHLELEKYKKLRNFKIFNVEKMASEVKILQLFIDGKWLTHLEIFGLATSLHWFPGGMKFMRDTMVKHNNKGITSYTANNFAAISYAKHMNYFPKSIKDYSKYDQDTHYKDFTDFVKIKKGDIIQITNKKSHSLEDAYSKTAEFIDSFKTPKIREGLSNKVHLIKVATGLGKTELISDFKGSVIAAPTNKLKNEILDDRMKTRSVKTLEIPNFEDEFFKEKLHKLYKAGFYEAAIELLKDVKNGFIKSTDQDRKKVSQYLNQNRKLNKIEDETNIITTHERTFHQDFNKRLLIYDEDPFDSLIKIKKFTMNDLYNCLGYSPDLDKDVQNIYNSIINILNKAVPKTVYESPSIDMKFIIKKLEVGLEGKNIFEDVLGFFKSNFFVKDVKNPSLIHYITKREIPKDKTVIIQSATLPLWIYQRLLGEQIGKIVDYSNVKHRGQIIQFTSVTCSRSSMRHNIKKIKKQFENDIVLTFQGFTKFFNKGKKFPYFGNCSGYDDLKGKNISVIGTPHLNPNKYILIARILGIQVNSIDQTMSNNIVIRNGYKFLFNCFDNEELREIQLSLIEGEMIQAVGRARALREDVVVKLHSNFPLYITTKFVQEKNNIYFETDPETDQVNFKFDPTSNLN